jgi:hypothetical protein
MNKFFTTLLSLSVSLFSLAQTQIPNGGFENWGGNASPGVSAEPTGWYSNKSGSSTAQIGPQTCFQDGSIKHSGSYSCRLENKTVPIVGTVVNGNVTTGVINAPSTNKADGYIGTVNYSNSSDIRRQTFTGRPDSIVGWYQYTSGGTGEQGKITAILHNNQYFDPETPTTNHVDPTADKIARATFLTPTGTSSVWKRFTAPFVYTAAGNPTYIMINMTPSNNQLTTFSGSKIWIDDVSFIYNTVTSVKEADLAKNVNVYYFENTVYVDLSKTENSSTLNITDLTGKIVFTTAVEKGKLNTIHLPSTLNNGMYLYQIVGSEFQKSGKFIIE